MHKNQHGFGIIEVIFIILVIGIIGFLAYIGSGRSQDRVELSLGNCGTTKVFTHSPVRADELSHIEPLGALNPPDHTLPTDHIYLHPPYDETTKKSKQADVFAPGDITVTRVSSSKATQNGKTINLDYGLSFEPEQCSQLEAKYGHVSTLVSKLEEEMEDRGNCNSYESTTNLGKVLYENCEHTIEVDFQAGEKIGTAGGKLSAALDMWMIDNTDEPLGFINADRYFDTYMHARCPLDYFASGADELYGLLGDGTTQRTAKPICGKILYDKEGTLMGNWFTDDARDNPEGWEKELALVKDRVDPSYQVVSISGVAAKAGTWRFKPQSGGTTNLDFAKATPGTNVYCYESEGKAGRVMIRLESAQELVLKYSSDSCAEGGLSTQGGTVYER